MKKVLRLPLALLVCGLISACGLMGGNGSADLTPAAQAAPAAKANAFNPWMNKSLPNTRTLSAEGMAMVQAIKSATYIIMEPLLVATALYFCLCFPLSKLIAYIERRMSRGDRR